MPILNLKVSLTSVFNLVIGWLKEKFKGLDNIFDALEAEGMALLKRDFEQGNPLDPENKAFKNDEQRDLIFGI